MSYPDIQLFFAAQIVMHLVFSYFYFELLD